MKAMALTAEVKHASVELHNVKAQTKKLTLCCQRWICAACQMEVVQSLPTVPNYHQGREAVPVMKATQAMELCAWVGHLSSILYNVYTFSEFIQYTIMEFGAILTGLAVLQRFMCWRVSVKMLCRRRSANCIRLLYCCSFFLYMVYRNRCLPFQ